MPSGDYLKAVALFFLASFSSNFYSGSEKYWYSQVCINTFFPKTLIRMVYCKLASHAAIVEVYFPPNIESVFHLHYSYVNVLTEDTKKKIKLKKSVSYLINFIFTKTSLIGSMVWLFTPCLSYLLDLWHELCCVVLPQVWVFSSCYETIEIWESKIFTVSHLR